ncbi:hypothetical protein ACPA9J_05905 [Pseudomonas aeruginosa]
MFQVTFEERDQVLRPLGEQGQEAVGSWATIRRWRSSPGASALRTITSASNSPRSPTRRSTRCAKPS